MLSSEGYRRLPIFSSSKTLHQIPHTPKHNKANSIINAEVLCSHYPTCKHDFSTGHMLSPLHRLYNMKDNHRYSHMDQALAPRIHKYRQHLGSIPSRWPLEIPQLKELWTRRALNMPFIQSQNVTCGELEGIWNPCIYSTALYLPVNMKSMSKMTLPLPQPTFRVPQYQKNLAQSLIYMASLQHPFQLTWKIHLRIRSLKLISLLHKET